jgi:hypothetical protein
MSADSRSSRANYLSSINKKDLEKCEESVRKKYPTLTKEDSQDTASSGFIKLLTYEEEILNHKAFHVKASYTQSHNLIRQRGREQAYGSEVLRSFYWSNQFSNDQKYARSQLIKNKRVVREHLSGLQYRLYEAVCNGYALKDIVLLLSGEYSEGYVRNQYSVMTKKLISLQKQDIIEYEPERVELI